jgi:hypothetical protein
VADRLLEVVLREGVTGGQIYARILVTLGLPFTAVIPCEGIEASFEDASDVASFRILRDLASACTVLPFDHPSEAAYYAAGKRLVDESEMLIAVWDGKPARGLGGTADVVSYAMEKGLRIIHVNPTSREELRL